jgi:hypothetical protein
MADERRAMPRLTLTCLAGQQCSVYFEPWGTEYILLSDDVFHVESSATASGNVEVSYVEGGIALTFTVDVPIIVTDASGKRLAI